jgi:hypothetical protein
MNDIHHLHQKVANGLLAGAGPIGTRGAKCGAVEIPHHRMRKNIQPRHRPLQLGFVALSGCAPVVMAGELALFAKYGVEVKLHREVGWATIRDKVVYGELDAAHAPAGLVVAASCGLGSVQAECLTGLVISLNGNAITLSRELWERGVRDAGRQARASEGRLRCRLRRACEVLERRRLRGADVGGAHAKARRRKVGKRDRRIRPVRLCCLA